MNINFLSIIFIFLAVSCGPLEKLMTSNEETPKKKRPDLFGKVHLPAPNGLEALTVKEEVRPEVIAPLPIPVAISEGSVELKEEKLIVETKKEIAIEKALVGDVKIYKVNKGETLMQIAFKIYGDVSKWKDLKKLNEGKISQDRLLAKSTSLKYIAPLKAHVWNPEGVPYLIKKRETLGIISNNVYQTPKRWREIWENNRPLIKNPHIIYAGFTLYYKKDETLIEKVLPELAELVKNKKAEEVLSQNSARAPSSENPRSGFIYSPHFSFLKIMGTNDSKFGGSSVTALSSRGFGVDVKWNVVFNDVLSFFGFGSIDSYSFYEDPDYAFSNKKVNRINYGIGANYQYSDEWKLTSRFSLREVSFLDIITPAYVNLDSIYTPSLDVSADKTIYNNNQFKALWGIRLSTLLPATRGSYKSKMGYGGGTGFEVFHKNKSLFLTYDVRTINIKDIKGSESTLIFGFNFYGDSSF
jgi:LysM repeat protein